MRGPLGLPRGPVQYIRTIGRSNGSTQHSGVDAPRAGEVGGLSTCLAVDLSRNHLLYLAKGRVPT